MPKFKVTGFADVPCQIEVVVDAKDAKAALQKAGRAIKKPGALRNAIVPNSTDEASAYDGRLYQADPI